MARISTRRATAQEFDSAVSLMKFENPDRLAAARCIIVGGETQAAVAERYGWPRVNVQAPVKLAYAAIEKMRELVAAREPVPTINLPKNWKQETYAGPPGVMKKLRRCYKQLIAGE